jgi:hypothetical protein
MLAPLGESAVAAATLASIYAAAAGIVTIFALGDSLSDSIVTGRAATATGRAEHGAEKQLPK